jgi:outer membrane protein
MNKRGWMVSLGLVALLCCGGAAAVEPGKWTVRAGAGYVDPKSDNNELVSVDSAASAIFDITYMFDEHWGAELLGAWPFEHDISLNNGPKVGDTKQLPPTLSVVYRILPHGKWRPYVGAGVNWTIFFDEDLSGPLAGADLSLDQSVGLAGVVGLDVPVNDNWLVNFTVRYINIDTDATVHLPNNGGSLDVGSVQIDPWVYGVSVGYVF